MLRLGVLRPEDVDDGRCRADFCKSEKEPDNREASKTMTDSVESDDHSPEQSHATEVLDEGETPHEKLAGTSPARYPKLHAPSILA